MRARPGGSASPVTRNRRYAGVEALRAVHLSGGRPKLIGKEVSSCRVGGVHHSSWKVRVMGFTHQTPPGPEGSNGRWDVQCLRGCGMEPKAWSTDLHNGFPPQGTPATMSGWPSLVGRQPAKLMGLRPRGFKSHPRRSSSIFHKNDL